MIGVSKVDYLNILILERSLCFFMSLENNGCG